MWLIAFIVIREMGVRREAAFVVDFIVQMNSASRLQMFASFSLVFLLLGWTEMVCSKPCPPLEAPRHGEVACLRGKRSVRCGSRLPVGTVAEFACREFYKPSSKGQIRLKCLWNGSWSSAAPKCIPDCGRRGGSVALIVNGAVASRGAFPWHVAMYYSVDGNYEYWCGGSLISESAVVTAAHCVWDISPENLMLALGKILREYNSTDKGAQKRRVKRIEILSSYQDVSGNYNGDVAVVFLRERIKLDYYSSPVCVDWEQRLVDEQLSAGTSGEVAGWGLTENYTLGDSLRAVRLPVVSDEKCIAEQEQDFKKFVTYTAFCAGFGNGTGVCNGDSGGGLAFFDAASARWYLQGVVSVSPRRKGTPHCDLNFYTVFTKVAAFSKWLKAVMKSEALSSGVDEEGDGRRAEGDFGGSYAPAGKRLGRDGPRVGARRHIAFPHTTKMLKLAGLL